MGNTPHSDLLADQHTHRSFFDRDNDDQAKGLMDKLKAVLYGDGILQLDKVMAAGTPAVITTADEWSPIQAALSSR